MGAQNRTRFTRTEPEARRAARALEAPADVSRNTRAVRRPYEPPRLERLGTFRALTLQQSVPIGPGALLHGGTGAGPV